MTAGSFVLGYHGCDRELGERVLAGDAELRPSTNEYDWLAEGIYIWENDAERGLHWAKMLHKHGRKSRFPIRAPFVLGVVADLGHCLDLLQAESIRLVSGAYHELKTTNERMGLAMPVNKLAAASWRCGISTAR